MLKSLHISNYALIDSIDIDFHEGLNIITGETGGGKSIMLGALSLLLGGRADSRTVQNTGRKSVIEAVFSVADNKSLSRYCTEADFDWDNERMILRREIAPNGRTRAFINDTPVTLERLREVGLHLVDIHSQHQNQLLSDPSFQLSVIDSLAGNEEKLAEFSNLFAAYRQAIHKLKATKAAIARDVENADFMQYQLKRIEELDLQPDELSSLESEREQLSEAADIRQLYDSALEALSYGEPSVMSLIAAAEGAVADIAETLPADAAVTERMENVVTEISDICETLRLCSGNYPVDAARDLEAIDERIARISSVMQRHNVENSNQLLDLASKMRQRLKRLDDADTLLTDLEKQARSARRAAMDAAQNISDMRRRAAADFAAILHDTAMPLGMKNLVCDIAVEPADLSATGVDKVDFRFAFNKNQTPAPVGATASGGEISRLMLSVKSIIAHKMDLPSIIFDEVDTGVSGDVADRMGRMMKAIGSRIQVIAITHLPQVAAKGNSHFKVFKHDTETSTVTHIEELSPERRIDEIALMLSGDSSNQAARAAATALLTTKNS